MKRTILYILIILVVAAALYYILKPKTSLAPVSSEQSPTLVD